MSEYVLQSSRCLIYLLSSPSPSPSPSSPKALFRLMEPSGGSITIDGINTSTLGLHDLRRRLSVIPQNPFLLSGTLRENLDPTGVRREEKRAGGMREEKGRESVI